MHTAAAPEPAEVLRTGAQPNATRSAAAGKGARAALHDTSSSKFSASAVQPRRPPPDRRPLGRPLAGPPRRQGRRGARPYRLDGPPPCRPRDRRRSDRRRGGRLRQRPGRWLDLAGSVQQERPAVAVCVHGMGSEADPCDLRRDVIEVGRHSLMRQPWDREVADPKRDRRGPDKSPEADFARAKCRRGPRGGCSARPGCPRG
jgi:hypothetical protein